MMMLKNFFILSTLITVGSNAYADGNQSTDSDAGAVHAKDDWSSSPNFGTFSTSLPFGWLDNVFSGYTFLGFGYSRLLMLGNSNIGMIAGADYALFEFSSYKQRVGQGGEDGTYTIIPARLNVSIASGYHRFYGYAGVSRQMTKRLQLGAYYSYSWEVESGVAAFELGQGDFAIAARYDFTDYLLAKVEIHYMDGAGKLFNTSASI